MRIARNNLHVARADELDLVEGNGIALAASQDSANSQVNVEVSSLQGVMLAGRGIISENYDLGATTGATIGVDGTAYFMLLPLLAGQTVTGIACAISTAGSSLTLSKVGLYDTDGTRLAVSADLGTAWESGQTKNNAFTAPYVVPTTGVYYAAIITKGSTQPTWFRNAAGNGNSKEFANGALLFGLQASQTDLPASATIAISASGINIWVGAY